MIICGTDLVSSLLPYVHTLSRSCMSKYCSQCLNLSTNLKRCSKCHSIYYCSTICQQHDWAYHKFECSHLDKLDNEYDLIRLLLRLTIRYRKDKGYQNSKTKRCLNDLITHENDIKQDRKRYMTYYSIYQYLNTWNTFKDLNENDVFQLYCRLIINTLTIHETIDLKPIGYGLYLDASQFNHSCFPTCHTVFNGIYLSIRTLCNETADEWTINYIDLLETYENRQKHLSENYYFKCQCKRCLKNDKNEIILLDKIHSEEKQMDKFIDEQQFLDAYRSSEILSNYYEQILPYYHAYVSLHYVKCLKLELLLIEILMNKNFDKILKDTCDRVQKSMGNDHPLTCEAIKLYEQFQLEMTIQQRQHN